MQDYRLSDYNFATHTVSGNIFLFNGMSGGMLRMGALELDQLRSIHIDPSGASIPPESLEKFMLGRYLIPADEDEGMRVRQRFERMRHASSVLSLTIAPTLRCNLSCAYCFESHDRGSSMSPDVVKRVIHFIRRSLERGGPQLGLDLCWFGGEPLLAPKVIETVNREVLAAATKLNAPFSTHVITNGVLLTPQRMMMLREGNLKSLQVTLDGPRQNHDRLRSRQGHGTFDRIVGNVERLRAQGLLEGTTLAVRFNVSRASGTAEQYLELIEGLRARGWFQSDGETYEFGFVERHDFSGAEDLYLEADEFRAFTTRVAEMLAERGLSKKVPNYPGLGGSCTAVNSTDLCIGPEGEVVKCWVHYGDSRGTIGHLPTAEDESPMPTWNQEWLRWMDFNPADDAQCSKCERLPQCLGGCPLRRRRQAISADLCAGTPLATLLETYIRSTRNEEVVSTERIGA